MHHRRGQHRFDGASERGGFGLRACGVWRVTACLTLAVGLAGGAAALAQDHPDLRQSARQLRGHVVTVRVTTRSTASANPLRIVCSGVIVSKRFVVTPVFAGSDSEVRVTLPQGLQSRGTIRLIDEYSGLALVRLDRDVSSSLVLADRSPETGSWVLSAAGWGSDEPVVSLGIVAAAARSLGGSDYPPLLQIDLRVTATSSGAGVVDGSGRLVGIVALVDKERAGGWTYAVPARHVQRLLRTVEGAKETTSLMVLKKRRPVVGMVLEGEGDRVVVARLSPDGPAAKAGLRLGDRVMTVNGQHIRSVYQAVRPMLSRQPGDRISVGVVRNETPLDVSITLGGGVELPPTRLADLPRFVQPKVSVGRPSPAVAAVAGRRVPGEVAVTDRGPDQPGDSIDRQRMALLEKSLRRYQRTLELLKRQLESQEADRKALQRELDMLKQELARRKKPKNETSVGR